jgi:hypothetical protein
MLGSVSWVKRDGDEGVARAYTAHLITSAMQDCPLVPVTFACPLP